VTELDASNAEALPAFSIDAPGAAPNVVGILIDDIGIGAASMVGGGIQTPTLDRLAQGGQGQPQGDNLHRLWHPPARTGRSCA
jgi:hypothetical protein